MCFDPISATALMAAGSAVSAAGALQAGAAQQAQANYAAKVAETNAQSARMKGAAEAEAINSQYDTLRAKQITQAQANGGDPNTGSASVIINGETEKNRALDVMSTLWNANSTATSYEHEAAGQKLAGKNARRASYIQAGSSFLTGMGQARATGTRIA